MAIFSGRRGSGGGTGAGFRLGPTDNTFGTQTSTLAQAEAARDAFATGNAAWLQTYDNDSTIGIYLIYSVNGDVSIQPQSRSSGEWVNNVGFIAVQGTSGADGNNFEFVDEASRDAFFTARPDLLVNNLPIIIAVDRSTIMNEIWTGQTAPSSYNPTTDAHFFEPASVMAATGSFLLGGIHRISSSGENITFRNTDTDVNYFPPWQFVGDHRDELGRVVGARPTGRSYSDLTNEEPRGAEATTGSVEYDVVFTSPRNESVFGVKVVPAEQYAGQVEYRVTRMGTTVVSYNQLMDVDTSIGTDLELWFPFPTENRLGAQIRAEIFKEDGTRLMVRPLESDANLAYTEIRYRSFTDIQLSYVTDEFNFHTRSMALTQDEVVNSVSSESLDGQFVYTPVSLGNVAATLTIEVDSELRGFDLVNLHGGTLTLVAGSGVLINGQSSVLLSSAYQGGRLIRDPVDANNYLFLYQSFSPDFIDSVVDTISASVNAGELTITLSRNSDLPDLTTTVTLPAQSTPTGDVTASITRFTIASQDTSVLSGTSLSGTRTFNYKVNHPEDVNGNLTLTQDGVTLRSDISPTGTTFDQAITAVTLANNEQAVFELRGATNEGGMFNARFTVRAHAPAEQLFYGLSPENNPSVINISSFDSIEAGVDNQRINVTTTEDGQYFIILTPANLDISSITDTVLSQDVTNIFTRTSAVRMIGGISYNSYVIGALVNNLNEDYILRF